MQKIRSHLIGIDQGDLVLFSDFEHNGQMWSQQGKREVRKLITFSEAYVNVPAISLNLSMWDMDHETNQRADISADNITLTGFEIVFRTWSDTRIARMRVSWQSIGEVKDEHDVWHLI